MKVAICVPTMGTVKTRFMECFNRLETNGEAGWSFTINSVIHHARNDLAKQAKKLGAEYILWLDSDMTFAPDTLQKLLSDQKDFVSGIAFTKHLPPRPTIIKKMHEDKGDIYFNYPQNAVFEIEGCGFGCLLMKTSLYHEGDFDLINGMGEDYSFCMRMKERGIKMYCDSRVKCGHIGDFEYDEELYLLTR